MSWSKATRADHEKFCQMEGWQRVRDARGRAGTHHVVYELDLPDGRILRTKLSHPVNKTSYGVALWRHILRDQLEVTESVFWSCVRDGVVPERARPRRPPGGALPAELVHLLITRLGLGRAEIASMSREDAIKRVNQYWAGNP